MFGNSGWDCGGNCVAETGTLSVFIGCWLDNSDCVDIVFVSEI